MAMGESTSNRRPIKSRSSVWARKIAGLLARTRITPDQISVASVFFAAIGAALLMWYPSPGGLLGCAAAIQARLLCNLLDGMVAVEGGKKSPLGPIYNEVLDRAADIFFILALGYAINLPAIGWLGALAATLTAYVRVFGGSLGFPQDFRGPLAKPQRMAVMTGACVLGVIEQAWVGTRYALGAAAVVIAFGSLATCVTRLRAIANQLRRSHA